MKKDTREEGAIEFDADAIVAATIEKLRNSGKLSADQKAIVERSLRRMFELKLQSIGSSETQLKQIRIEFGALRSTLITIGESVASNAWSTVESLMARVLVKGLEVAL